MSDLDRDYPDEAWGDDPYAGSPAMTSPVDAERPLTRRELRERQARQARAGRPAPRAAERPRSTRTDTGTLPRSARRDTDAPTRRQRQRRGGVFAYLREIAVVLVAAVILSWVVKTFLVQPFWIPTGSMETTLDVGDRVMVSKLTPGVFDLHRGDVVVFKDPGDWLVGAPAQRPGSAAPPPWLRRPLEFIGLAPETGEKYLIKRIVGLPGDVVEGTPGEPLRINGVDVQEPYLNADSRPTERPFRVTVPEGRVWVMGDHRSASGDSRFHDDGTGATGSIRVEDIVGRAIMVVWPLGHGKWVDNYDPVFADVPAPGSATSGSTTP